MAYKKECVLTDRECIDCGDCDMCDLNPKKVCDNCCKCIDKDADYKTIEIDEIIEDETAVEDEEELKDWKYNEDYIVDYSSEENDKANATRKTRRSDN